VLRPLVERHKVALALVIALTIMAIGLIEPLPFTIAPFVGSLMVGVFLIYALCRDFSTPATEFLGRASYHLFISHWVIASLLVSAIGLSRNTPALLSLTVVVALLLSCALVPIERWIDRARWKISLIYGQPASKPPHSERARVFGPGSTPT
jgi:peptidoglycan/LPS O-acetylase OafA/YrhL